MADFAKRGGMSFSEARALLESDERFARERAERERLFESRRQALAEAEAPILRDLSRAGANVSSAWSLDREAGYYPAVIPVLLEHLVAGGYPDRIMEGLARGLNTPFMTSRWDEMRDLYLQARSSAEAEGLAASLAQTAARDHLPDLWELLNNDELDGSRIFFVQPLFRLDKKKYRERLAALKSDPVLGREIRAQIGRGSGHSGDFRPG